MRVGVFTYGMDRQWTGIGRYAAELVRALRRCAPTLEIVLLNPYPSSPHPLYREFDSYPLPQLRLLPVAASLGNWTLHRAALELKLDILHDPCGVAPFLIPTRRYKRVTTVHDAVPFIYPRTQPLLTRAVFHTLVKAARFTADAVLTVSEAAARDLASHARIPKHKLFVTPNGGPYMAPLAHSELPETDAARLAALGICAPYLLYVGALHPRKNLARVIAAFAALKARCAEARLVIVGPPSWGAHEIFKHVLSASQGGLEGGGCNSGVSFTGFVSDEELRCLYKGARALVFPSLYEGFGLPALEAMAYGTPVLSSNVSSLPEVVGDAGLLVDPLSTEAILEAMYRLWTEKDLRNVLAARGLKQAQHFTWERTAHLTLEVYQRLVA